MHNVIQASILGLLTGGVYALMASGLTLVFGIMRVINVAQGMLVILAAFLSYTLFGRFHLDPFLSILVVTPAIFVLGVAVQGVFIPPLRGAGGCGPSPLIPLGLALGIRGLLSA